MRKMERFITIASGYSLIEANLLAGRLKEYGINAGVLAESATGAFGSGGAISNLCSVQVPESDCEMARKLLWEFETEREFEQEQSAPSSEQEISSSGSIWRPEIPPDKPTDIKPGAPISHAAKPV